MLIRVNSYPPQQLAKVTVSPLHVKDQFLTLWRPLLPNIGTAVNHLVPDRVKPSFVIFDIWALWRSGLSVRVPRCQNDKWRFIPVWHKMIHSCRPSLSNCPWTTSLCPRNSVRDCFYQTDQLGTAICIGLWHPTCNTLAAVSWLRRGLTTVTVFYTGTCTFIYADAKAANIWIVCAGKFDHIMSWGHMCLGSKRRTFDCVHSTGPDCFNEVDTI